VASITPSVFIFNDMEAQPFRIFPMSITVEGAPLPASLWGANFNNL
jgi:hypothetical protein